MKAVLPTSRLSYSNHPKGEGPQLTKPTLEDSPATKPLKLEAAAGLVRIENSTNPNVRVTVGIKREREEEEEDDAAAAKPAPMHDEADTSDDTADFDDAGTSCPPPPVVKAKEPPIPPPKKRHCSTPSPPAGGDSDRQPLPAPPSLDLGFSLGGPLIKEPWQLDYPEGMLDAAALVHSRLAVYGRFLQTVHQLCGCVYILSAMEKITAADVIATTVASESALFSDDAIILSINQDSEGVIPYDHFPTNGSKTFAARKGSKYLCVRMASILKACIDGVITYDNDDAFNWFCGQATKNTLCSESPSSTALSQHKEIMANISKMFGIQTAAGLRSGLDIVSKIANRTTSNEGGISYVSVYCNNNKTLVVNCLEGFRRLDELLMMMSGCDEPESFMYPINTPLDSSNSKDVRIVVNALSGALMQYPNRIYFVKKSDPNDLSSEEELIDSDSDSD